MTSLHLVGYFDQRARPRVLFSCVGQISEMIDCFIWARGDFFFSSIQRVMNMTAVYGYRRKLRRVLSE
ncbi:unnamed protein product [Amoebophrya sp. A120]|nr:unnamed protein product [Amoebophrya sp. A120]|eukprot:GSA120T00024423001.1